LKFERKEESKPAIPTASLPDIIFMLLIFFMVSTVFKEFRGIPVALPAAKKIEKLPGKRDVAYVYLDRRGTIMIDDRIVSMSEVDDIMYAKRADKDHPLKVTSLKFDKQIRMDLVNQIHEELKKADALNINYSAITGG